MLAVAEAALADQVVKLDKAGFDVITTHVHQAELANPRGVDQFAAAGEVEQPRGGGGVRAFAGQFGERPDAGIDFWQQTVDQR